MKTQALLILLGVILNTNSLAVEADYTTRNFSIFSCKLFANDTYHAADGFARGDKLSEVLKLIEQMPVADRQKHRMFQAIQFVWKHRLDNPVLAQSIAMGLCLKPKHRMAPMDEPWVTSPRTSKDFY
ncbi:MAG: hypothetical protein AAF410_04525 [Pseudomonadota bacterium]